MVNKYYLTFEPRGALGGSGCQILYKYVLTQFFTDLHSLSKCFIFRS